MWLVAAIILAQRENIPIITESSSGQHWPGRIHNKLTRVTSREEDHIGRRDERMFSLFTLFTPVVLFYFHMRTHSYNLSTFKINVKKFILSWEFRDAGNLIQD